MSEDLIKTGEEIFYSINGTDNERCEKYKEYARRRKEKWVSKSLLLKEIETRKQNSLKLGGAKKKDDYCCGEIDTLNWFSALLEKKK